MPTFALPYGTTSQLLVTHEDTDCQLIVPKRQPGASDPQKAVRLALEHPLEFQWPAIFPHQSIAITVNDKTRPVPNHIFLPPLLEVLHSLGANDTQITIWIATGSHLPMPKDEFGKIVPGQIIERYPIKSHNIDDTSNLIDLGFTTRGTPIWTNQQYYNADLKIVTGDIEPHHFAGYSGGYKSAAIGLAGRETINRNHAMLVDPRAWIGEYDENPLRQDIDEIGRKIGVHFALNAVLNHEKQVVAVFSGHPSRVQQAGILKSKGVSSIASPQVFDLVVASAGGYPKDINFYQAQKAITHASMFCKKGGTIILVAECIEGAGSKAYVDFMQGKDSIEQVFSAFQAQGFSVGPHKAFQVARLLQDFRILMVSAIDPKVVRGLLIEPAEHVQTAFDMASKDISSPFSVAILPHATTTMNLLE